MLTTHKEKEEKINIEEAYKIYKEEAGEQIEEIELKKSFVQKYRDKVEQQADIKRKIKSEQRYSDTDRKLEKMRKYSLQGTTQGRYLTGGVPPVRFSM